MSAAEKIIQPHHLCNLLNVKNIEEAKRVLATGFSMLAYLSPGDSLETSDIKFQKISKDLIFVNTKTDLSAVVDSMDKARVLRIPV